MSKRQDEKLAIRVPSPLRAALEMEAEHDGRPVASLVRKILVEHVSKRIVECGQLEVVA